MPRYRRAELWSDLQAASGTRLAVIPDVAGLSDTRKLSGEDELVVLVPRESVAWDQVLERRLVRVVYADDTFDEWRIAEIQEQRGQQGLLARLRCEGVLADLATTLVKRVEGASPTWDAYDFEAVHLSPTAHVTEYILQALIDAGMTWWALGTITPTTPVDLVYAWDTPLSALRRLAELTDTELQVRRNGTTQYLIDLIAQVGSTATTVDLRLRKNLRGITRERSAVEQATRIYPKGAPDDDAVAATIARNRWEVTGVSGTDITLADPSGGDGPIGFVDQLNGLALEKAGGTYTAITDTAAPPSQVITVADATGISVGDLVRIVRTTSGDPLTYLEDPARKALYGLKSGIIEEPTLPDVVNVIQNPAMRVWTGAASAPPDDWTKLGSPTLTRTTTAPRWRVGEKSCRIQGTADGDGLETDLVTVSPSAERPFFSGYMSFYLIAGTVRVELVATDGATTWILPTGDEGRAWSDETEVWKELGVAGIDLQDLGATQAKLRIVQDGATAIDVYVDAAQITQWAGQEAFVEGAGPTRLWQRGNQELLVLGVPKVTVAVDVVDLERLYPDTWPADALMIGGDVQITDVDLLGGTVTTRLLERTRDLLTGGDTKAVLSNHADDLIDELVRPARWQREVRTVGDLDRRMRRGQVVALTAAVNPADGSVSVRVEVDEAAASIRYAYGVGTNPSWPTDAAVEGGTAVNGTGVIDVALPAATVVPVADKIRIRVAAYERTGGLGPNGATDHGDIAATEAVLEMGPVIETLTAEITEASGAVTGRAEVGEVVNSIREASNVGVAPAWPSDVEVEGGTVRAVASGFAEWTLPVETVPVGQRIRVRAAPYVGATGLGPGALATEHGPIVAAESAVRAGPQLLAVQPDLDPANGTLALYLTVSPEVESVRYARNTGTPPQTRPSNAAVEAGTIYNLGAAPYVITLTYELGEIGHESYVRIAPYEATGGVGDDGLATSHGPIVDVVVKRANGPDIASITAEVDFDSGTVAIRIQTNDNTDSIRYAKASGAAPSWPSDAAVEGGTPANGTGAIDITLTTELQIDQVLRFRAAPYDAIGGLSAGGSATEHGAIVGVEIARARGPAVSAITAEVDHEDGDVTVRIELNEKVASIRHARASGTAPSWPSDGTVEAGTIVNGTGAANLSFAAELARGEKVRLRAAPYEATGGVSAGGSAAIHGPIAGVEVRRIPQDLRARVKHASTQTIVPGSAYDLNWDTEEVDVGGLHNTVTNNQRLTVPSGGDGIYTSTAILELTHGAWSPDRVISLQIWKNGTTPIAHAIIDTVVGGSQTVTLQAEEDLNAGDYLTVYVSTPSSGSGSTTVSANSRFSMTRLEPPQS